MTASHGGQPASPPAPGGHPSAPRHEPRREQPVDRRRLARAGLQCLWATTIGFQFVVVLRAPAIGSAAMLALIAALCASVQIQARLSRAARGRAARWLAMRLADSSYLSELQAFPNRNYLLWQLRNEMLESWRTGSPFVIAILSVDDLASAVERRGAPFGARALSAMAEVVERLTRRSDFAAYLGEGDFVIVLHDCSQVGAGKFLRRVPPTLGVGDGRRILELAISIRLLEYDLESAYASDVLEAALAAPRHLARSAFPESLAA